MFLHICLYFSNFYRSIELCPSNSPYVNCAQKHLHEKWLKHQREELRELEHRRIMQTREEYGRQQCSEPSEDHYESPLEEIESSSRIEPISGLNANLEPGDFILFTARGGAKNKNDVKDQQDDDDDDDDQDDDHDDDNDDYNDKNAENKSPNAHLDTESLLRERDTFLNMCKKNRFYANPNYKEPWKIFSRLIFQIEF